MNLFSPDNFSNPAIKYKDFEGDTTIFQKILDNYFDDFELIKVSQLDRKEINSNNFRVVIIHNGEEKVLLIRKNNFLNDKDQIIFYLSLISKLKDADVPVSDVLETKGGDFVLDFDNSFYVIFVFLDSKHFSPNKESYASVAKGLVKMHKVFLDLDSEVVSRIKKLSESSGAYYNIVKNYTKEDFLEIESIIKQKDEQTDSDNLVLSKIPLLLQTVEEVKSNENEASGLSKQVIHSDLHPHNILMKNNNLEAIIDFDGMRISERSRDVAFAIYRLGRQFFVDRESKDIGSEAEELQDYFIKNYEEIYPLSNKEKQLMPYLIKDEFLRKILFVLKGIYIENNHTWAHNIANFLPAIEEINYFWPN